MSVAEIIRGSGRPEAYRLADGERVPSVTTITNRFKDSGGLLNWANSEGLAGRTLEQARKGATDVGSLVHRMVEATIHGESLPHVPDELSERVSSAFGAWQRWFEGNRFQVVATEVPLLSEEWKFGGTIDTVAKDSQGQLCILDWKSSRAFYADMAIQVAAYGVLWNENAPDEGKKLTGGFHIVRFDKEHGDLEHRYFPELDSAWAMFMLFRQAYELDRVLKRRMRA